MRRRKSNPCFVGDPGVGKTAIAEGLASSVGVSLSFSFSHDLLFFNIFFKLEKVFFKFSPCGFFSFFFPSSDASTVQALRIAEGTVPPRLRGKRIHTLEMSMLVAGP